MPEVELVGDVYAILLRLAQECRDCPSTGGSPRLREAVDGILDAASRRPLLPAMPPRALLEIREALGREDILVSDVGLHKLWIGRSLPGLRAEHGADRQRPRGNGLRRPRGDRGEAGASRPQGGGGLRGRWLPHELPGARDRDAAARPPFVNVVWENRQYGSIVWKQEKRFGRHFGTDFDDPDFVRLAESFGMPAWRCESIDDYRDALRAALDLDVPSLIALPIDYSVDIAVATELGTETTRIVAGLAVCAMSHLWRSTRSVPSRREDELTASQLPPGPRQPSACRRSAGGRARRLPGARASPLRQALHDPAARRRRRS